MTFGENFHRRAQTGQGSAILESLPFFFSEGYFLRALRSGPTVKLVKLNMVYTCLYNV